MWALLDFSYLAHRAFHSTRDLEHNELKTGIIYGFFEQLRTICADPRIATNQVALFFDSRQSFRRRAFPGYKGHRRERMAKLPPEEQQALKIMREQMRFMHKEILPEIGFRLFKQTGLESDDLIAKAAASVSLKEKVVIVTGDGDLYQCITDDVHWYDPSRDKYFTPNVFTEKKKVSPDQWVEVKAIAGCSSDDVPGVKGVGEKTAIDYINGFLPKTYKRHQAIQSKEGQRIIERNRPLVKLPHRKTKPIELEPPVYNRDAFAAWCKKLGIRTYLKDEREREWNRFFNNTMDRMRAAVRTRRHE